MTPDLYYRRRNSLRRPGHDYTEPGIYSVTLCAKGMDPIFGCVHKGIVRLNNYGLIAQSVWNIIPSLYPNVILDEYVVMPNHLHGIILLKELDDSSKGSIKKPSLSEIIRRYKCSTSRMINHLRQVKGESIWHRSFNDRIFQEKSGIIAARKYILNNPEKWNSTAWADFVDSPD